MRKTFWFVILSAVTLLPLLIASPPTCSADEPAPRYVGVSLAPAGDLAKVEMISQTVDVTITEAGQNTMATVRCAFKLHNTDKFSAAEITLGFPGWGGDNLYFAPGRLANFSAAVGDKAIELERTTLETRMGGESRQADWYVWRTSLAPDEKRIVRVNYGDYLGDGYLPEFIYVLTPSAGWQGSVGSARITIRFPQLTTPEQMIAVAPEWTEFDGQSVTWLFVDFEPDQAVGLTFIKPALWRQVIAARQAIAQDASSAAAHHALGLLYRQLSEVASPLQSSFYAQAVSEFEAAKGLDPTLVRAYTGLAALYHVRATRQDGSPEGNYLALVIAELEGALQIEPENAGVKASLAEAYFYMAAHSQAQGDYEEALAYLDKAKGVMPTGGELGFTVEEIEREREAVSIAWAEALFDEGKVAEVLRLVKEGLLDDALTAYEEYRPSFRTISGEVSTGMGERRMTFNLQPYPSSWPESMEHMRAVEGALASLSGITVTSDADEDGYTLQITIPFTNTADLLTKMRLLAEASSRGSARGALPPDPSLAPLSAALTSHALELRQKERPFITDVSFREEIDVGQPSSLLELKISQIEAAIGELAAEASPAEGEARRRLQLKLLGDYKRAWQTLLSDSHFVYQVTFRPRFGQPLHRTWSVRLGQERTLRWSLTAYNLPAIGMVVLAGVVALVDLAALAWLVKRRGSNGSSDAG